MSEKPAPRAGSHSTDEVAPLSPYRAFVVQFRTATGQTPGHFAGRVEHMTSGQAARFSSSEELVAFLTQILTQGPAEPPQKL
jgi:hypothetical protein